MARQRLRRGGASLPLTGELIVTIDERTATWFEGSRFRITLDARKPDEVARFQNINRSDYGPFVVLYRVRDGELILCGSSRENIPPASLAGGVGTRRFTFKRLPKP